MKVLCRRLSVVALQRIFLHFQSGVQDQVHLRVEGHAEERQGAAGALSRSAQGVQQPIDRDGRGGVRLGGLDLDPKGLGRHVEDLLRPSKPQKALEKDQKGSQKALKKL